MEEPKRYFAGRIARMQQLPTVPLPQQLPGKASSCRLPHSHNGTMLQRSWPATHTAKAVLTLWLPYV